MDRERRRRKRGNGRGRRPPFANSWGQNKFGNPRVSVSHSAGYRSAGGSHFGTTPEPVY